jgi:hypothetical protein
MSNHTLTISVPVKNLGELDVEKLEKMLGYAFEEGRSDNRPDFWIMALSRAMDSLLQKAVRMTVEDDCICEYKQQVVQEGYSEASRWYLEASARLKDFDMPWIDCKTKVKLTEECE